MPRAFCPECGSEVPVDADGTCHVGHQVDLPRAVPAASGHEGDEPQPWVATVDSTTLGGFTPPPGEPEAVPDQQPWTPDDAGPGGGDDLAAAAAAAIESLETDDAGADHGAGPDVIEATGADVEAAWPQTLPAEGQGGTPGWTPPTNDPVAPAPVPAPAPVDPPAPADGDDDASAGDFDLDDLAAAVTELGMDDEAQTPAPRPAASDTPPPVVDTPAAGEPTTEIDWDDDLGEPAGTREADESDPVVVDSSGSGSGPVEEVDLSNFTAKGGRVRTGGNAGKGGLFRRR